MNIPSGAKYYQISDNGIRKIVFLDYLLELKPKQSKITVTKE